MFDQSQFHVYVEKVSVAQYHDHHQVLRELKHQEVSIYQRRHYQLLQLFNNQILIIIGKIKVRNGLPHFHEILLINMPSNKIFINKTCII
jgi:hypothetical protein